MIRRFIISLILLITFIPLTSVHAQGQGPIYIVQPGDTLGVISARFGVSMTDIMDANSLTNPDALTAGIQLVIPGLTGISGILVSAVVPLGETLQSLSLKYQVPVNALVKLNRLTSPNEVFAGSSIIIPQQDKTTFLEPIASIDPGQSLLETAAILKTNPWDIVDTNSLAGTWDMLPSELLFGQASPDQSKISNISPLLESVVVHKLPLVQGQTEVVEVNSRQAIDLSGELNGKPLHFFQQAENQYIALQGIYAMADIGLANFVLKGTQKDGKSFQFNQSLLLEAGNFGQDPKLYVPPETVDPAITKPEDDKVASLTAPATPTRYWSKVFKAPNDVPDCIKSLFGNRRSFNDSAFTYFHTGVDYGVCVNSLNIYAVAPGIVVFTGLLDVRGNTTIIDHGWGVYSGYYHQSEIQINVGDKVEEGQVIGQIGKTGRVTGPHLHWDMFVNGIQVQPLDWLDNLYP